MAKENNHGFRYLLFNVGWQKWFSELARLKMCAWSGAGHDWKFKFTGTFLLAGNNDILTEGKKKYLCYFFAGQISVPGVNWFIGMHCFCSKSYLLLAWIFAFGLKDLKTQPEPDCGLNGRCIFKCTCNKTHSIIWWPWCSFRIILKIFSYSSAITV